MFYVAGHMEIVCTSNNDTTNGDHHTVNGTNITGDSSKNTMAVNNVDVVNNNESHKTEKKQINKNSKKDKSVNKDTKMNNISHSDDSSEESTDNEIKQDTEIIFIRDLGFNVKIVCPGTEAFEIQVCYKK